MKSLMPWFYAFTKIAWNTKLRLASRLMMNMSKIEIRPPWVELPGFPPGDFYWRDAGQPWFNEVWETYWKSLTTEEQADYLSQWKVPETWRMFYFDPIFRKWLESTDNAE